MSEGAREVVLGRIRRALADVPESERPEDVPVVRHYRAGGIPPAGSVEVVDLFAERLADYGAAVRLVTDEAAAITTAIAIVVIVLDNGQYGTIRMHQERDYPGRVVGTQLVNPDFALYARAFGGHGERVERTEEFAPAFERAVASGKPAILHCLLDPRAQSHARDFLPAAVAAE